MDGDWRKCRYPCWHKTPFCCWGRSALDLLSFQKQSFVMEKTLTSPDDLLQAKARRMLNFKKRLRSRVGKRRREKIIQPGSNALTEALILLTVVKLHEHFVWVDSFWINVNLNGEAMDGHIEFTIHSRRRTWAKIRLVVKSERVTIEAENRLENSSSRGESWNLIISGRSISFPSDSPFQHPYFSTMTNWAEIAQITKQSGEKGPAK